jgi:hypothetical protein
MNWRKIREMSTICTQIKEIRKRGENIDYCTMDYCDMRSDQSNSDFYSDCKLEK